MALGITLAWCWCIVLLGYRPTVTLSNSRSKILTLGAENGDYAQNLATSCKEQYLPVCRVSLKLLITCLFTYWCFFSSYTIRQFQFERVSCWDCACDCKRCQHYCYSTTKKNGWESYSVEKGCKKIDYCRAHRENLPAVWTLPWNFCCDRSRCNAKLGQITFSRQSNSSLRG